MELIYKIIARTRSRFTPLEKHLLVAVGAALPPQAGKLFQAQIAAVNKVQRLGNAREVNFYRMRSGKPFNEPATAFADRRREAELARVRFRVPGETVTRRVTIYTVKGFVFSLVFDPPAAPIDCRDDVEILSVEPLGDPMRAREPPPAAAPSNARRLAGVLKRWHEEHGASTFRQPLAAALRRARVQEIPAQLPPEYLHLIEQTEGFVLGNWTIYGLLDIYSIALDDAEYLVLAELHDSGVLAIEKDGRALYFLPFDRSPRRPVAGFAAEIEAELGPVWEEGSQP